MKKVPSCWPFVRIGQFNCPNTLGTAKGFGCDPKPSLSSMLIFHRKYILEWKTWSIKKFGGRPGGVAVMTSLVYALEQFTAVSVADNFGTKFFINIFMAKFWFWGLIFLLFCMGKRLFWLNWA